jgi:hypothetical protein
MTWQLDTELDVYLRWIIGNGHGARTRGDDRWSLSSFTNAMNVEGAFVRPKGSIVNSKRPYLVRNAVFGIASGSSRIWWYPDRRSILEKNLAPTNRLNMSSIQGNG